MDKDLKDIVIVMAATLIVIGSLFGGIFVYSGMNTPLTVVESYSMQHSDDTSYLGVIDTGDMVIMRNPDNVSITTYVEGYNNGYNNFGDYGDVIIYYRENANGNPIIHRAILWLEYNNDVNKTWSAPALKYYPTDKWNVQYGDYTSMSGKLTLYGLGYKNDNCSVELDILSNDPTLCHSGYLTKGDHNDKFDQSSGIPGVNGPIPESRIKAVAGLEIPWIGCIKLYVNDINVYMIPSNSIPCLIVAIIDLIAFFIMLTVVLDYLFGVLNNRRTNQFK